MNKREIGVKNREAALRLLAQLGYATTRQIAKSVWGKCDNSSRKLAARLIRSLVDDKLVITRRNNDDINAEQLAALTKAGAKKAEGLYMPMQLVGGKVHARDYLRYAHEHRTMCNSVFVAIDNSSSLAVYSELEVRASEAPVSSIEYIDSENDKTVKKIADLIAENSAGIEWFEVENTWRSDADLQKVIDFMRSLFAKESKVKRVNFVITNKRAKTIGSRLRKRLTHGFESGWPRQIKELDARILEKHIAIYELNQDDLTLLKVDF